MVTAALERILRGFRLPETASSRLTAAPTLTPALFHADQLKCPKCGQPIRRTTAAHGSFVLTCPNRTKGAAARDDRSEHCGQTMHILAADGVAIVTPISKEAFGRYRRAYPGGAQVYQDAGIIAARDGADAVGSFPCRECGTPTKLFDLYGGLCRDNCAPGYNGRP